jgi:hypothetical protein
MVGNIEVIFRGLGVTGATLVVLAVGSEVYSATAADALWALRVVARRASDQLATRGQLLDPRVVVKRGRRQWNARLAIRGGIRLARSAKLLRKIPA